MEKKFDIGKNFYLIYSPERDDPGNNIKNFYVPRLVSGKTKKCLIIGKAIYSKIFQKLISTSDMQTAEITKLFENVFRSINIGLVNEMKKICYKMNMNVHKIIDAASTKPYGFLSSYRTRFGWSLYSDRPILFILEGKTIQFEC